MMLFNPLFLQNESGSENLFIAKPGTIKKKGYLFADIMRVYFNDSGKKNTLNSKLNLTSAEKSAGNKGLPEQKGASAVSLLTSNKTFVYKNNGTADAVQTNDLIANTPIVKVNLDKLKSILSKLLGGSGHVQTGDTEKLIKQLLSQLNKEGEIVLSVAQHGEKVAVDVSKVELAVNGSPEQINKKSDASGKSKAGNQNYAIKIVAIPPNFNLSNLKQKINDAASGEIKISEENKINVPVPGGKGNRIITVFSIAAKSNNLTGKEVKNVNPKEINKLVNSKVQNGSTADAAKAVIIEQSSGSKVIPGSSFSINSKEGMKDNASKNISSKASAANSTNSISEKSAVTIPTSNGSAEINGDALNQKSAAPISKTVVQTAGIKDISKSKIINNTNGEKNIGSTEVITAGKTKIILQKKSKIGNNAKTADVLKETLKSTKTQSGVEKSVSAEKGTTATEPVKPAPVKTEKVTVKAEAQKSPEPKTAEVNKEAVKSTKVQSGVEKSVSAEKGATATEPVKPAPVKTEKVTVKAEAQKSPEPKTAEVNKEAVKSTKVQSGVEKSVSAEKGATATEPVKPAPVKTEKVSVKAEAQKSHEPKTVEVNKEAVKSTKVQSGVEKSVSAEKGTTTTEPVKTASVKTEKVTVKAEAQKSPEPKIVEVNKEAVKSTKVQSGVEKSVSAEKGTTTTEPVKTASVKTEKVTDKAAPQKASGPKTAEVIKEAVKNTEQQINQNKKTDIPIKTAAGTPVPKSTLSSINETYINNPVVLGNQTIEGAGLINSQTKKGIKINQAGKDKKDTNGSSSSTENPNKLKADNNAVQPKENKQQNQNFENEANKKNNLTNGQETDGKEKPVKFNIQNVQNSNFNKNSIHEFSSIFGRPEKMVKLSELVKEFSQFIKKKGKTKLVLQLDPAKLGKVKITLDVIKDVLKAHIEVETNAAKQTVQNNLQELYAQLNKSGINLGSVNITLHEGGSKETKQFSNKRRNGNSLDTKEDIAEEEENTTTRKLGYNTYEFLA